MIAPSVRLDLAVEERSSMVACGCGRALSSSSYLDAFEVKTSPPPINRAAAPAETYAYVRLPPPDGWRVVVATACAGRAVREEAGAAVTGGLSDSVIAVLEG